MSREHDKQDSIVTRLRSRTQCCGQSYAFVNTETAEEAADMLEFFLGQMQMHNPDMGGSHHYRFRSGGWPMTHCKGPTAGDAARAAAMEIKREREKQQGADAKKE